MHPYLLLIRSSTHLVEVLPTLMDKPVVLLLQFVKILGESQKPEHLVVKLSIDLLLLNRLQYLLLDRTHQ